MPADGLAVRRHLLTREKPMAFKTAYKIRCSCGESFAGELYEYIFTEYDPEIRDALLTGEFNWVTCPSCKESFYVENRFLYRDERNKLWIWVCKKEEARKGELFDELMDNNSDFKDHFLDDKSDYKKHLVFGRDALIELLLREDRDLKRVEGKRLKKNPALRMIVEMSRKPGLLFLSGEKVRIALPLRMPSNQQALLSDTETKVKWLKYYSQGLNIHNLYSSFLNKRMKAKWDKIREKEPEESSSDGFDDFAQSWASNKMHPKGFKTRYPLRQGFFDDVKKINITRMIRSINTKGVLDTETP
jgi:hypothetical protein